MPVLGRLFIHPVKSARAIEVESARIDARGLEHDRRWMVVDATGVFLTQRELPKMALLGVRLDGDGLVLSFPGLEDLRVGARGGARREVVVWEDRVSALSAGVEAAAWLERALGQPCELVSMPRDADRRAPAKHDPSGSLVSFADAFPLLVLSSASVEDLSRRAGMALDVRRFRPNLVIDGCEPYAEDAWRSIAIGPVVLRLVKPCTRCTIVTVDPESGEIGKEPLVTLATYRARERGVTFGHNAVAAVDARGAVLRVGQDVRVLETTGADP